MSDTDIATQQSVNTNVPADPQQSTGQQNPLPKLNFNFDTSEADAILGGIETQQTPPQVQQQQQQQPAQQQTQQQVQLTPDQISSLRQQLQVQQQVPNQQQSQTSTDTTDLTYSDSYINANSKFKEQTGLDFGAAIDEYMVATVGMPLKETIQTVQDMSAYINQRQQTDVIEQATTELRTDWGNNYDAYMKIARDEYDKLPQQTAQQYQFKQSLNNAQGAKLLLAQALQNQGANTAVARTPVQYNPFNAPSPAATVANGHQPQLRMSEILSMNDQQYNSAQVQQALALGAGKGYIDDVTGVTAQTVPIQGSQQGTFVNPSQMMLGY